MNIRRKEVWLLDLDPTKGHELKKTRPVVVVSTDVVNKVPNFSLRIVVPLTSWQKKYDKGWFVRIKPNSKNGLNNTSAVDPFQIRSVSTLRFKKKLGKISDLEMSQIEHKLNFLLK
ncbi:MAG: type II toxin-antitoxin system PemK/MazF family toxin [Methanobacterium sp.]|nr:type II toxin-antitoxin system PemK/MazF family toxin [Methanobacterium sp.]MBV1754129.1 type II toxin-antitoxin system PemK/MazF family toxin [Methanobacterium sp.]